MKRHITVSAIQTEPLNYEGQIKLGDLGIASPLLCCAFAAVTLQRYWLPISCALAHVHLYLRGSKHDRIAYACEQYLNANPAKLELQVIAVWYLSEVQTRQGQNHQRRACEGFGPTSLLSSPAPAETLVQAR